MILNIKESMGSDPFWGWAETQASQPAVRSKRLGKNWMPLLWTFWNCVDMLLYRPSMTAAAVYIGAWSSVRVHSPYINECIFHNPGMVSIHSPFQPRLSLSSNNLGKGRAVHRNVFLLLVWRLHWIEAVNSQPGYRWTTVLLQNVWKAILGDHPTVPALAKSVPRVIV